MGALETGHVAEFELAALDAGERVPLALLSIRWWRTSVLGAKRRAFDNEVKTTWEAAAGGGVEPAIAFGVDPSAPRALACLAWLPHVTGDELIAR